MVDEVTSLLLKLGFHKRTLRIYTQDVAPDVLGWIGLTKVTRGLAKGEAQFNPGIGIRFQLVHRVVAECTGEQFHTHMPPTLMIQLGYLMPEERLRGWVMSSREEDFAVAQEMVAKIEQYGVPFMRSVPGLDALQERLEGRSVAGDGALYYRPATAFLRRDFTVAERLLDESVASFAGKSDAYSLRFLRFAGSLRQRMASES